MKIRHCCLFCAIPAIFNHVNMRLFTFISTNSNFNNFLVFNSGTNFDPFKDRGGRGGGMGGKKVPNQFFLETSTHVIVSQYLVPVPNH